MPSKVIGFNYLSMTGLEMFAVRKGAQNSLNDSSQMCNCCNDTWRPILNSRHIANDIFKCIFLNENVLISLKISLKCVLKFRINNFQALLEIVACHRLGVKPLS